MDAISEGWKTSPDRPALVVDGTVWTVGELARCSGRLAAGLSARGVERGDRVAVHLHNRVETVLIYLACLEIGAIVVPLNTRLTTPELAELVRRTGPVLYVGETELYERFAPVPAEQIPLDARFQVDGVDGVDGWNELLSADGEPAEVLPALDDPAFLLSTSGTTGRSKLNASPDFAAWKTTPSLYIATRRDRTWPPSLAAEFARRCRRVVPVDTGHSPFLSAPGLVADLIRECL